MITAVPFFLGLAAGSDWALTPRFVVQSWCLSPCAPRPLTTQSSQRCQAWWGMAQARSVHVPS